MTDDELIAEVTRRKLLVVVDYEDSPMTAFVFYEIGVEPVYDGTDPWLLRGLRAGHLPQMLVWRRDLEAVLPKLQDYELSRVDGSLVAQSKVKQPQ